MFSRSTTSAPLLQILKACFFLLVFMRQEGIQRSLALPGSKSTARSFPFLTCSEAHPERSWALSCPLQSTAPWCPNWVGKGLRLKKRKKARNKEQSASAQFWILTQWTVINADWSFSERSQKLGSSTDSSWRAREPGWESELASHSTFSSLPQEGRALSGDHTSSRAHPNRIPRWSLAEQYPTYETQ